MSDDDNPLLRDLKRLRAIKVTCTVCGRVSEFSREEIAPVWRTIDQKGTMPATWDLMCPDECVGLTTHFLEWPDKT